MTTEIKTSTIITLNGIDHNRKDYEQVYKDIANLYNNLVLNNCFEIESLETGGVITTDELFRVLGILDSIQSNKQWVKI